MPISIFCQESKLEYRVDCDDYIEEQVKIIAQQSFNKNHYDSVFNDSIITGIIIILRIDSSGKVYNLDIRDRNKFLSRKEWNKFKKNIYKYQFKLCTSSWETRHLSLKQLTENRKYIITLMISR